MGIAVVDAARDAVVVNDKWCGLRWLMERMGRWFGWVIDVDLDVDAAIDRAVRRASCDAALRRREETMPGYIDW